MSVDVREHVSCLVDAGESLLAEARDLFLQAADNINEMECDYEEPTPNQHVADEYRAIANSIVAVQDRHDLKDGSGEISKVRIFTLSGRMRPDLRVVEFN